MPIAELSAGNIHYAETGPVHGRAVVAVHGYTMGASLWRQLGERLSAQPLSDRAVREDLRRFTASLTNEPAARR